MKEQNQREVLVCSMFVEDQKGTLFICHFIVSRFFLSLSFSLTFSLSHSLTFSLSLSLTLLFPPFTPKRGFQRHVYRIENRAHHFVTKVSEKDIRQVNGESYIEIDAGRVVDLFSLSLSFFLSPSLFLPLIFFPLYFFFPTREVIDINTDSRVERMRHSSFGSQKLTGC